MYCPTKRDTRLINYTYDNKTLPRTRSLCVKNIFNTYPGSIPWHLFLYLTSHPRQLSLAIPSWVGAISTSERAVMPWGVEYRQGMVRVWMAGKNCVNPLLHTDHVW